MSESPHELLEQGYTHFHRQDYQAAFEVWSLVLDHPQSTEDDRAAARECLELLDQEQARSGSVPATSPPDTDAPSARGSSVFDGEVTSDGSGDFFASGTPFRMMSGSMGSDPSVPSTGTGDAGSGEDVQAQPTAPVPQFDQFEPPPSGLADAPPSPSGPARTDMAALQSRLAETEAQLRDARERITQLEQMVNEANHAKRETEVKLNKAEHDLLSKMNELSGLNVELATVSREVLTKDREMASMRQALEQAGGTVPADVSDPADDVAVPDAVPADAVPAEAATGDAESGFRPISVAARSAATPALFRSIDTNRAPAVAPRNGSHGSSGRSSSRDRASEGDAGALTTSHRMTLQTMLKVPRTNPDPESSSRAFNLQRVGAGIVRTGLHPRSRPVNWIAVFSAIGLMVSVVLPWRTGLDGGPLMIGDLPALVAAIQPTLLSPDLLGSLVELLYLLPVLGISLLVWETVHWSLGYDGHFLMIVGGLLAAGLAVAVFGFDNPTGPGGPFTFVQSLQWHLQFVRAGFWTAVGSSALLVLSGIVWPRARSQRRSAGHIAPVSRQQVPPGKSDSERGEPDASAHSSSRDVAMTN